MKKLLLLISLLVVSVSATTITNVHVGTNHVGPFQAGAAANTNDLRLYLKMDDADFPNETCVDSSGHGLDFDTIGDPNFDTTGGKVGGCLGTLSTSLNGTSQYAINTSGTSLLKFTTNFTVCAWIYRFAGQADDFAGIFSHIDGSPFGGYRFSLDADGTLKANIAYDVNAQTIVAPTPIPSGAWTHVALTWDNATSTGKIYTNGVLAVSNGSMTGPITYADPNINIGSGPLGNYLKALVDEARAYNGVLINTELLALPGFP